MFKGEHTYKVTLKKRTQQQDSSGQMIDTWIDDRTIYAERWERQGKEGDTEGQVVVIQDVRWKVRYISGLNERDYRIEHDGKVYDIENIQEQGRRKFQLLMTSVRDND